MPIGRNAIIVEDVEDKDINFKIELNPSLVLSSDNTHCKNDIQ